MNLIHIHSTINNFQFSKITLPYLLKGKKVERNICYSIMSKFKPVTSLLSTKMGIFNKFYLLLSAFHYND